MAIERLTRDDRWNRAGDDEGEWGKPAAGPLTAQQALALRARRPSVSPWRVLKVQIILGACAALLALGFAQGQGVGWSALYGCATVVLPGLLMARGMTRPLRSSSPGASAVSVMSWSMVKIGVSVLMLLLAPRVVQPLSWPALLSVMVLCMQVYWLALLWRGR